MAHCRTLDDATWLELTARTLAQQPALDNARIIATRAADHPRSPTAQAIVTRLLGTPTSRYQALAVEQKAAQMLEDSHSHPGPAREALREALINAGRVEAAFIDDTDTPDNAEAADGDQDAP
jgi:hypothetical protein